MCEKCTGNCSHVGSLHVEGTFMCVKNVQGLFVWKNMHGTIHM